MFRFDASVLYPRLEGALIITSCFHPCLPLSPKTRLRLATATRMVGLAQLYQALRLETALSSIAPASPTSPNYVVDTSPRPFASTRLHLPPSLVGRLPPFTCPACPCVTLHPGRVGTRTLIASMTSNNVTKHIFASLPKIFT